MTKIQQAALAVEDLTVEFDTRNGVVRAVDAVTFSVAKGAALGILGESGSGKSVTASAIMGVLDTPPARVSSGRAFVDGQDVLALRPGQRRAVLGEKIAMVFQDALTALNPVQPVGRQIGEVFRIHRGTSRREARKRAVEMMDRVQIPAAARRAGDYPHQFSGGMRQRIMIAMALALDPDVLVADEPTTALDVTVQAQILQLLKEEQASRQMALVLITHDLAVASQVTDDVVVMYAGRLVETGRTAPVLDRPTHPYSLGLARSVADRSLKGRRLPAIPGQPPDLLHLPGGCAFAARCELARERCTIEQPTLRDIGSTATQASACHFAEEMSPV